MTSGKTPADAQREEQVLKELRRDVNLRQQGYRERALKLLPHVCASCGREFSGKRLRELTVHHKDRNWQNNPSDGSNWELLCLFCHDHEHEKYKMADYRGGEGPAEKDLSPSIFAPFAELDKLVNLPADDADAGTDPAAPKADDGPPSAADVSPPKK